MANKKSKVNLSRINLNIPTELKDRVHKYADSLGINYTSAFIVLLNNGLNNNILLEKLPRVLNLYSKFNEEDILNNYGEVRDEVEKLKIDEGIDITEEYKKAEEELFDFLANMSSDSNSND